MAPVLDPESGENTGVVLRLGSLPRGATGVEVSSWADELKEAAAEVAVALAEGSLRELTTYAAAGLRKRP